MIENIINKKMIICDSDGTLVESKQPLDTEMARIIEQLLIYYRFAIISGSPIELFERNFLPNLELEQHQESNFFLLPAGGSALYRVEHGQFIKISQVMLTTQEIQHIISVLESAVQIMPFDTPIVYGQTIEIRGSEVTYSGLGQDAPLEYKQAWDPDHRKRIALVNIITPQLPGFQISLGGTTSVDITRAGIDKSYGIHILSEHTRIPISQMLYIGDALYPNGNDETARASGIECYPIDSVSDTKELLQSIVRVHAID